MAAAILAVFMLSFSAAPTAARPTYAACAKPSAPIVPGRTEERLTSGNIERSYILVVAPGYDGTQPVPLVFSFHGFASNAPQQEQFSGWERIAATTPMIVVFPQGTGFPARWYAGTTSFTGKEIVDDVRFVSDLIDALSARFCIDPARIYANGLSNGGGMTNRLACDLSARIAAIGTVAGAYPPLSTVCSTSRPVPVIAFHGDTDPIVPYKGDSGGIGTPDIVSWASAWAARNSCHAGPDPITSGPAGSATHFDAAEVSGQRWHDCAGNGDVILYTIAGGGHTWPGGDNRIAPAFLVGRASMAIDATAAMWDFYQAHPLPPGP